MIGFKWSILKRLSCSQAKMRRGSRLCEQLHKKIVQQFKNNVSQRSIAGNLGISSSTVHNIIKRFTESGELSPCKRQGRKPTLNVRDLWSLRRHCIKNRHHCVKDRRKKKKTIQIFPSAKFESQHLWWYGCVLVPMTWATYTSVMAPSMLKGTSRFWSNTCCHPSNVFFRDVPAYFSKTHSVRVTTAWLRSKRVWVLDWPACSRDLQSIGNARRIM